MKRFTETVTSKDNPNVRLVRKLMTSKKERLNRSEFVLEGARLVLDALDNGADIKTILMTETALKKHGEKLYGNNTLLISDELGQKIADTEKTQGIFAVCGFPAGRDSLSVLRQNGRYAAAVGLQDPGNAGMMIRTADAIGLDGVIFCESCDIYSPKAVRATMGSLFRIPVWHGITQDELFGAAESSGTVTYAAVVDSDAEDVKTVDFSPGGLVIIGNEGNGLSEETVKRCRRRVTIKMNGNIESLNAAMAAGIIMWELTR